MLRNSRSVLIFFGPPGSGKSTQAMRIAEKFGTHHFETSRMLEQELAGQNGTALLTIDGKEFSFKEERRRYQEGEMVTPIVTAYLMQNALRRLAQEERSVVFSGSPRTLFEAQKIFPFLEELFGASLIRVFLLFIKPETASFRLRYRRVCGQCALLYPWREETKYLATCLRCQGLLCRRGNLDSPEAIKIRFRAYEQETLPAIAFAEQRGYPFAVIDGEPHEDIVAGRVLETLSSLR